MSWGGLSGQDRKMRRGIRFLGSSSGGLGGLLGLSWAFWGLLGPSLAVLGRLGVVWGRLKFDVKIDQKIDTFQDRFLTRCWWILGRKWRQVGTRIDRKSDHKLTSYQKCRTGLRYCENDNFFNRNGVLEVQASIKNRPKIDQKSIKT